MLIGTRTKGRPGNISARTPVTSISTSFELIGLRTKKPRPAAAPDLVDLVGELLRWILRR